MNIQETNEINKLPIILEGSYWFAKAVTACTRRPELEVSNQFIVLIREQESKAVQELDDMTNEQMYLELKRMNTLSMALGTNFYWGYQGNDWLLSIYFEMGNLPMDYTIQGNGLIVFDESEYGNKIIKNTAETFKQKLSGWPRINKPLLTKLIPEWKPNQEWLQKNLKT